jgi:hypothetical protein
MDSDDSSDLDILELILDVIHGDLDDLLGICIDKLKRFKQ